MTFTNIVDRRKNGKNKSVVNRNRFLKRAKKAIKKRVDEIVADSDITDIGKKGDKITIPKKDVSEPHFNHGKGGNRKYVLPGNKDKVVGDQIAKPQGGKGDGGPKASDQDDDQQDDFSFNISREEFLDFFFEDLELPDLIKTNLKDTTEYKMKRAGHTTDGSPSNLNILRSMRKAMGRKLALEASFDEDIKDLEEKIKQFPTDKALKILLKEARDNKETIPFIDDLDLRYNSFEKQPEPTSKAVMFCLMDVSGSMGMYEKDLAKRFFMLLYLFLDRKYEKVEILFIRHTTVAEEVDEQTFFYDRKSGGTIVSTALKLASEILQQRYPTSDYNIYFAQASDGDNWDDDAQKCLDILRNDILPFVQYYAYVQVSHQPGSGWGEGELWDEYATLKAPFPQFAMKRIGSPNEIYPVFRDLFQKGEDK